MMTIGFLVYHIQVQDLLWVDMPLNQYDANSLIFIQEDGDVGIGTNSPNTDLELEATTSPTLRITEIGQTGYLELVGYHDSQSLIRHTNETTDEASMMDIDVISSGTELKIFGCFEIRMLQAQAILKFMILEQPLKTSISMLNQGIPIWEIQLTIQVIYLSMVVMLI